MGLMMRRLLMLSYVLALLGLGGQAHAVIDGYEFDDEVTRERYLAFIEEMRCPKCQNQNLAGSDSPIAADLRRELYRMLDEGKSDKEIVDFMVARYGDYVLYRPQVKADTLLLWGLPGVLLLVGFGVLALTVRQRRRAQLAVEENDGQAEEGAGESDRLKKLLEAARQRNQSR